MGRSFSTNGGEGEEEYLYFIGGENPLERPRHRWVRWLVLREIGWSGMDWIKQAD
jgi:hypothetical protein